MKFKFPNIKLINLKSSLKMISTIVIIGILLMIAGFGFFLYQYFYKTIAYSDEIILLKQEVAPESIDVKQVDKISKNLAEKKSAPLASASPRNPFSFGITPLAQPQATTTLSQ